ncbi:arginine--tRNA ligase [Candidatus Woesearchaeota archaeon]|jgi:arginyl-tRNA synthetase|nr:arginine--tRNA ligase [Candidatus Woesearchaeota archaeon]MBT5396586.1 arginine--tRNA ligase [Candidatus Woesearchaeota archaeon]MBT6367980.1 arginine--tRNA ligase [Candidatus Woesearchaeota archaeon]MBT7762248.1 arginine--tRNA ligase [Candidatus Woesearchaeota archaeon]
MDFKQQIIKLLIKETKLKKEEIETILSIPPDPKLGEYSFPCFTLGKNPKDVAEKLKKKIKVPKFISKIDVVGPYLNFFVNYAVMAEDTLSRVHTEKKNYGKGKDKRKIVIEYCGPNTNKPLHLGHLRNMALGNAVYHILSYSGNKVHPVNIINDRGIHICQSMLAYQKWGKNKAPDKKGDHFVGDYYVLFSTKSKDDETLKKEAQNLLIQWEMKNPDILKLWKKMNKWVLDGFKETYKRFGVSFEKEYFESEMYTKGKDIVMKGLKNGVFKEKENGIVAELEKFKIPNKVVLRSDGTSVYMTQDLQCAEERYNDFHFDKMMYVVASEQNTHFKQLFKIVELLKRPYAQNLYHLSYGLVHLPTGRMKSREGTVVDADDIMDEISNLAKKEVLARYKNISAKEVKERAEFIALGAIKFFMLKTDPSKDIVFNPKDSLSFEGETGPYVQYTHARACSILRKAKSQYKLSVSSNINFDSLTLAEEHALVRLLSEFPHVVMKAAKTSKPHHIANYCIALAQAFNEFYHKCPVLSELEHQMKSRLLLVDSVKHVLHNGLALLGIKAPEKM